MPPIVNRFGGPHNVNAFSHLHQQHQQQQFHNPTTQGQPSGSSGLPPPSVGAPSTFAPAHGANNFNPFAVPGGINAGLGGGFDPSQGLGGGSGTGLGSREAKLGFAHGAALQQQQQQQQQQAHNDAGMGISENKGLAKLRIREVWRTNLAQEMAVISDLAEEYPYIAVRLEFGGLVARPLGSFAGKTDYHYQVLRTNTDLSTIVQLGLTLFNADGELPPAHPQDRPRAHGQTYQQASMPNPCTWQFNFKFSLQNDMYVQDNIEVLQKSGVDFAMLEKNGIDPFDFGAQLIPSGLVLSRDVTWLTFGGGYDFSYLMKIMLSKPFPDNEDHWTRLLQLYFPSFYDSKYIIKNFGRLHENQLNPQASTMLANMRPTGLHPQEAADLLQIKRSPAHQSVGSDSLMTGKIHFEMRRVLFDGAIDDELFRNQVFGIRDTEPPANNSAYASTSFQTQEEGLEASTQTMHPNGNAPSTPLTGQAGISAIPAPNPQNVGNGMGALTPGGGGGVFGGFEFSRP